MGRIGKLFLDFAFHAPTVSFPEPMGIMIEPTESYTKSELDDFIDACLTIYQVIDETPEVLLTVPHFTPISLIDELNANKNPIFYETIKELPQVKTDKFAHKDIQKLSILDRKNAILAKHKQLNKK